jgi:hypothetical protein
LKGNLTPPLDMENKHRRRQIEGICANRMKTKHVIKSHEAWGLLKMGAFTQWLKSLSEPGEKLRPRSHPINEAWSHLDLGSWSHLDFWVLITHELWVLVTPGFWVLVTL